jgi:hypothetical protein
MVLLWPGWIIVVLASLLAAWAATGDNYYPLHRPTVRLFRVLQTITLLAGLAGILLLFVVNWYLAFAGAVIGFAVFSVGSLFWSHIAIAQLYGRGIPPALAREACKLLGSIRACLANCQSANWRRAEELLADAYQSASALCQAMFVAQGGQFSPCECARLLGVAHDTLEAKDPRLTARLLVRAACKLAPKAAAYAGLSEAWLGESGPPGLRQDTEGQPHDCGPGEL